jgi:hypothetical protein
MCVHHARDSIKAEPIEHEYIHVESQIGEKEPQNFMTAVIEQSRIPELVSTTRTLMEVLVIGAIELVDTQWSVLVLRSDVPIQDVLACVRVNHV